MSKSQSTLYFSNDYSFSRQDELLGTFSLRALDLEKHIQPVCDWIQKDYAKFWNMQNFDQAQLHQFYSAMQQDSHQAAFMGFYQGEPAFLVEIYDPAQHELAKYFESKPEDCGMHLLIAPPVIRQPGFSLAVMRTVMEFLFQKIAANRVIVEPDIHNHKIHRLNERVGIKHIKPIELPQKTALLGLCSHYDYTDSLNTYSNLDDLQRNSHLMPHLWQKANRDLLRKILAETCHEQLLKPHLVHTQDSGNIYQLPPAEDGSFYRFQARTLPLDHWLIDPASIEKIHNEQTVALDALEFLIAYRTSLPIRDDDFPLYLEEISSTLAGSCYKLSNGERSAEALQSADYQAIEAAMSEGHPTFIANNGRIGFSSTDYRQYAPETAAPLQLVWLAAHKNKTTFSSIDDLDYHQLLQQEIDGITLTRWHQHLVDFSLNPDDYFFMPVHPWQWRHKISITFAAEVANRDLVYLGKSPDFYRPQQSIRTFYNISCPHKAYVKTALSILNMGFMRGLSPEYMEATPAINQWIDRLLRDDAFLQKNGFTILREIAAIGYRNPIYRPAVAKGGAYGKMLSALWRESPKAQLKPGQNLMTMAALLHIDPQGNSLLEHLIKASGETAETWISAYLKAYLTPLLHCFYEYDLAFMPHGENLIMVLKNAMPQHMIMKDIGEEIGILNGTIKVPDEISRIHFKIEDSLKVNYIFTDIFDGFFRYLAAILDEYELIKAQDFWALVADTIYKYQLAQPQHHQKYQDYDLFPKQFVRNCYNRLQLRNNRQMLNLQDQTVSFQYAEPLDNPLAPYKR